jgi:hypothetical protein
MDRPRGAYRPVVSPRLPVDPGRQHLRGVGGVGVSQVVEALGQTSSLNRLEPFMGGAVRRAPAAF